MAETISLVLNVDTAAGTTAVKGLSTEVKNLKDTADKATPALANTNKATKEMSDKATQTKGAVAALAAAVGMISPEAQKAVQGLGNVSGALGGVGKAALALGASAGPLAILAAAVGAIAIAWKIVGDEAKKAEDKQTAAAKKATERAALSNVRDRVRLEAGYKSGKIDEATYQETLATAAGEAYNGAQINETRAALTAAQNVKVDPNLSHDEYVTAKSAKSQNVSRLKAELDGMIEEQKQVINDTFTAAVSTASTENKKDEKETEAKAKKLAENAVALKLKAVSDGMQKGVDSLATKGSLFGAGSDASMAIAGGFKLPQSGYNLGVAGLGATPAFSGYTLPEAVPGVTRATSAQITHGYDYDQKQQAMLGRDIGNLGMGGLSLAGGNVGGALASLGPAGAIVGGLSAIGQNGAKGVDDQLTGFKDMMIEALEALPEILSEVIPEFVTALVTEVVPALVQALPAILKSLLIDLPIAIAKAIASAINPFDGGKLKDNKKGFWDALAEVDTLGFAKTDFGKSHAVGRARITEDGPAMLHEGEAVLARADADAWRSGGGGGGSNVTHVYNINGPVGDAAFSSIIEKQLSQRFGPGGVGYSTGLSGGLRGS